jgi:hypothetical protein
VRPPRDDEKRVRALWFLAPDRVSVDVQRNGRLRYRIANPTGQQRIVRDGDMLHITGPLSPDGYMGRSVVTVFATRSGSASRSNVTAASSSRTRRRRAVC